MPSKEVSIADGGKSSTTAPGDSATEDERTGKSTDASKSKSTTFSKGFPNTSHSKKFSIDAMREDLSGCKVVCGGKNKAIDVLRAVLRTQVTMKNMGRVPN